MMMKSDSDYAHYVRTMVDEDYVDKGKKIGGNQFLTVVFPPREVIDKAKDLFCQQNKELQMDKQIAASRALSSTQAFIRKVQKIERSENPDLAVAPWESTWRIDQVADGVAVHHARVMHHNGNVLPGTELFRSSRYSKPAPAVSIMSPPAPTMSTPDEVPQQIVGLQHAVSCSGDQPLTNDAQPYLPTGWASSLQTHATTSHTGKVAPQAQQTTDMQYPAQAWLSDQAPVSSQSSYGVEVDKANAMGHQLMTSARARLAPLSPQHRKNLQIAALKKAQGLTNWVHTHHKTKKSAKETYQYFATALLKCVGKHSRAQIRNDIHQHNMVTPVPGHQSGIPDVAFLVSYPQVMAVAAPSVQHPATNPHPDPTGHSGGDHVPQPNEQDLHQMVCYAAREAAKYVDQILQHDRARGEQQAQDHYKGVYDKQKAKLVEEYVVSWIVCKRARSQQQSPPPGYTPFPAHMEMPPTSMQNPYLTAFGPPPE
jgi:hypothetical protein